MSQTRFCILLAAALTLGVIMFGFANCFFESDIQACGRHVIMSVASEIIVILTFCAAALVGWVIWRRSHSITLGLCSFLLLGGIGFYCLIQLGIRM